MASLGSLSSALSPSKYSFPFSSDRSSRVCLCPLPLFLWQSTSTFCCWQVLVRSPLSHPFSRLNRLSSPSPFWSSQWSPQSSTGLSQEFPSLSCPGKPRTGHSPPEVASPRLRRSPLTCWHCSSQCTPGCHWPSWPQGHSGGSWQPLVHQGSLVLPCRAAFQQAIPSLCWCWWLFPSCRDGGTLLLWNSAVPSCSSFTDRQLSCQVDQPLLPALYHHQRCWWSPRSLVSELNKAGPWGHQATGFQLDSGLQHWRSASQPAPSPWGFSLLSHWFKLNVKWQSFICDNYAHSPSR